MAADDGATPWRDGVTIPWIVGVILRGRRTIFAIAAIGFVVALAIALFRATYYTSSFSFIPQTSSSQGSSGLASLAGQFGISVGGIGGQSQSPQLYADLLQTREILDSIARDTVVDADGNRVLLSVFLKAKGDTRPVAIENTMRALRDNVITTSVATRTTGVVTVTARTRSPRASLSIASQLLDGLNRFNLASRKTQAGEERRFVEQRLADAQGSLRDAENALQRFLQANRQFTGSPDLTFQKERLERAVTFQQQLVTELAQQYEEARIREVRDTPVITVLEHPELPVLPDPRGRAMTVVLGTLASILLGIAYTFVRAGWSRSQGESAGGESDSGSGSGWRRVRARFNQPR